MGEMSSVFVFI